MPSPLWICALSLMVLAGTLSACAQYNRDPNYPYADSKTPHVLQQPAPVYPPRELARHVLGKAVVRIDVDIHGHVTRANANVIDNVDSDDRFSESAAQAVRQWTFDPPKEYDQPVPATNVLVVVTFNLPLPANPSPSQITDEARILDIACKATGYLGGGVPAIYSLSRATATCRAYADFTNEWAGRHPEYPLRVVDANSAAALLLTLGEHYKDSITYSSRAIAAMDSQGNLDEFKIAQKAKLYEDQCGAEVRLRDLPSAQHDCAASQTLITAFLDPYFQREHDAIDSMYRNQHISASAPDNSRIQNEFLPILEGVTSIQADIFESTGHPDQAKAERVLMRKYENEN